MMPPARDEACRGGGMATSRDGVKTEQAQRLRGLTNELAAGAMGANMAEAWEMGGFWAVLASGGP